MDNIIIKEEFIDDSQDFNDKIIPKSFSSAELIKVKIDLEESKKGKIDDLISYKKIEKNLYYKLPHQKEGAIKILRDLNATALLADEVGLGKTITTGMVIKEGIERDLFKKILILAPPSLVEQWYMELKEKFEINFKILNSEKDWLKNDLIIASIDKVKSFDKELKSFKHKNAHEIAWDLVVVDEAHKLKERNTIRWKFVDSLTKKRFLLLTATPFQNDLLELYSILHLLKRGHLGTINEFKKKYLAKGNKRKPLNAQELRTKLKEVMIRRKRKEVGIEYKKRIPKIITIEQTPQEKIIYDMIVDLLKDNYFSNLGEKINSKLMIYSILPKITSSPKSAIESLEKIRNSTFYHERTKELSIRIIKEYEKIKKDTKIEKLREIIKEITSRSNNEKILIYTRHPTTQKYINENLKDFGLRIIELSGELDRKEKEKVISLFKQGKADILISTDTGSEGLNFQFCRNLINYDLPWNPMLVEQRIGRIDRIGQKRDMFIYSFATKDTMEEYIVDLIINKMCCVGLIIGELPIILFNLGLDEETSNGITKIEEKIMNAFIESKGNLEIFNKSIKEIAEIIEKGVKNYEKEKEINNDFFDD